MISVQNLHAHYGQAHILNGVNLTVVEGETVAIIGRNGMGKTTLLRCLTGVLPATTGSIKVAGQPVTVKTSPSAVIQRGVGYVPEGRGLFYGLTVAENLRVARRAVTRRQWGLPALFKLFPILEERQTQVAGTLSGGQQQMLAIARALANEPVLLILDEPSIGLAPPIVEMLAEVLPRISRAGLTLLVVEQNLALALAVSQRLLVMEKGRIVNELESEEAQANRSQLSETLGLGAAA